MKIQRNFLPEQYDFDAKTSISHSYLQEQFANSELIFDDIRQLVAVGDFTLGRAVDVLEDRIAMETGCSEAIGVGSGTDAIRLSLMSLELEPGTGIVCPPFTFIATVGAIVGAGLRPVFADIGSDLNIDASAIASLKRDSFEAVVPVHWSGRPIDFDAVAEASRGAPIIEDACHALMARYRGQPCGSLGLAGCFSFHPLKNLNVWGDGGIVTTSSSDIAKSLRLKRNHGLVDRDTCVEFGVNSRLDTLQALVALRMLTKLPQITRSRQENAGFLNATISEFSGVRIIPDQLHSPSVYHLYQFWCEDRDGLMTYLRAHGVDAKAHYPKPIHLHPASRYLGYGRGDFPMAELAASQVLSLPVHEFVTHAQLDEMVTLIDKFLALGG